jgi:hypothetical protein
VTPSRRAAAGFVLTAAGLLASRLGVRRATQRPEAQLPTPEPHQHEPSSDEVERARVELADELARRSSQGDS